MSKSNTNKVTKTGTALVVTNAPIVEIVENNVADKLHKYGKAVAARAGAFYALPAKFLPYADKSFALGEKPRTRGDLVTNVASEMYAVASTLGNSFTGRELMAALVAHRFATGKVKYMPNTRQPCTDWLHGYIVSTMLRGKHIVAA